MYIPKHLQIACICQENVIYGATCTHDINRIWSTPAVLNLFFLPPHLQASLAHGGEKKPVWWDPLQLKYVQMISLLLCLQNLFDVFCKWVENERGRKRQFGCACVSVCVQGGVLSVDNKGPCVQIGGTIFRWVLVKHRLCTNTTQDNQYTPYFLPDKSQSEGTLAKRQRFNVM